MSTLKVNQIEPRVGGDVTIGESGGTVTLADGATAVGFAPEVPEYPVGQVRAWVNFNGTGTVAIRDSMNVSSITDNGIADYTINFTTAMPDSNYSGVFSLNVGGWNRGWNRINSLSTTTFRLKSGGENDAQYADSSIVCVSIVR